MLIDMLRAQNPFGRAHWKLFRAGLWAASLPYGLAMKVRRSAYRAGLLPSRKAQLPVISVGNVTAGGTGKTPTVAWIVDELKKIGHRPAVVLRGYKARHGMSDEAKLLAQLTGATVIANPDRLAGAQAAAEQGATVIVLDDAFQHQRIRRNLEIVLVDATDPFGLGHCLPRGLLREPLSALCDAHAIVITRSNCVTPETLAQLAKRLAKLAPQASIHRAQHQADNLIGPDGKTSQAADLAGTGFVAFCGIGNPGSFFDSLRKLNINVLAEVAMDDHCHYSSEEMERLRQQARQCGARAFVTTQKDYVKIEPPGLPGPLWQLAMEIDITDGKELLRQKIKVAISDGSLEHEE